MSTTMVSQAEANAMIFLGYARGAEAMRPWKETPQNQAALAHHFVTLRDAVPADHRDAFVLRVAEDLHRPSREVLAPFIGAVRVTGVNFGPPAVDLQEARRQALFAGALAAIEADLVTAPTDKYTGSGIGRFAEKISREPRPVG